MTELDNDIITAPVVKFKKRAARTNEKLRKRPDRSQDSDNADDYSETDSANDPKLKKRKKNADLVSASSKTIKSSSTELLATDSAVSRDAPLVDHNDATKQSNWYDEKLPAAKKFGPAKTLSSNVRMTTITDFSPDVCKDFRQTGFCGFGDSCKFLHDRSNYKQGWELDKEWENLTKGKKDLRGTIIGSADRSKQNEDEAEAEEDEAKREIIPPVCIICKESYKFPIVTKCGHYFCELCALNHYRKNPGCAVCGAGTNGIFKSAKGLQSLLEKQRGPVEK